MRICLIDKNKKQNQEATIFDTLSVEKKCDKHHDLQKNNNLKTDENYNKINLKRIKFGNNISIDAADYRPKGKIFNIMTSSYTKNTLGSIPRKTEKILLSDKKQPKRFDLNNSIFKNLYENIPGVGKYNLSNELDSKIKSVHLNSEEIRFQNLYNNIPGVGDYNIEIGEKLQNSKNNLRYNNLYNKTRKLLNGSLTTHNKKIKHTLSPISISYTKNANSKILNIKKNKLYPCKDIIDLKLKNLICNNITGKKDEEEFKGDIKDFFEENNNNNNNKTINVLNSNNYKRDQYISYSYKDFKTLENERSDRINFILKQKANKNEHKVYTLEDIYKRYKEDGKIVMSKKQELEKELKENENFNYSKKLKFNIRQDRELNKIKKILGNDNGRRDFFNLSPSRWKEDRYKFKVPGPAYYFYS